MGTRLTKKAKETFESIKRVDENGIEWWSSRELAKALTYTDYRNFLDVMRKAWNACQNSGQNPNHHFVRVTEMISLGKGAEREVETWLMSRYVCYLAVQNANPGKTIVAQAQTYFAIQTRRAELLLASNSPLTEEEEKRLLLRNEMRKHNTQLAGAANNAGVKNLFRATQTEDVLRKNEIKGKNNANRIHKEIGAKVRKAIRDIGGTMPENLPTTESIKRLENKQKRLDAKKEGSEES